MGEAGSRKCYKVKLMRRRTLCAMLWSLGLVLRAVKIADGFEMRT